VTKEQFLKGFVHEMLDQLKKPEVTKRLQIGLDEAVDSALCSIREDLVPEIEAAAKAAKAKKAEDMSEEELLAAAAEDGKLCEESGSGGRGKRSCTNCFDIL